MKHQGNIFDFLRFAAAGMVIWGHAYDLNEIPGVPVIFATTINSMGLLIFFIVSGYLVTQSLERSRSAAEFFWKRALRIMPGLATCTFLTAFVMGPLVTNLPQSDYWSSPLVTAFLKNSALNVQFLLPGVFQQNHITAVNGSLWSLPVEALCYIFLGTVGLTLVWLKNKSLFVLTAALSLMGAAFFHDYDGPPIVYYNVSLAQVFLVAQYFFVGSAMEIVLRPRHFRLDIALGCIPLLLLANAANIPTLAIVVQPVLLSYLVLTIGQLSVPVLRSWSKPGDASYGMYLYAFPIQQVLAGTTGGATTSILSSILLSAAIGYASWHAVEKHALKLKNVWGRGEAISRLPPLSVPAASVGS